MRRREVVRTRPARAPPPVTAFPRRGGDAPEPREGEIKRAPPGCPPPRLLLAAEGRPGGACVVAAVVAIMAAAAATTATMETRVLLASSEYPGSA